MEDYINSVVVTAWRNQDRLETVNQAVSSGRNLPRPIGRGQDHIPPRQATPFLPSPANPGFSSVPNDQDDDTYEEDPEDDYDFYEEVDDNFVPPPVDSQPFRPNFPPQSQARYPDIKPSYPSPVPQRPQNFTKPLRELTPRTPPHTQQRSITDLRNEIIRETTHGLSDIRLSPTRNVSPNNIRPPSKQNSPLGGQKPPNRPNRNAPIRNPTPTGNQSQPRMARPPVTPKPNVSSIVRPLRGLRPNLEAKLDAQISKITSSTPSEENKEQHAIRKWTPPSQPSASSKYIMPSASSSWNNPKSANTIGTIQPTKSSPAKVSSPTTEHLPEAQPPNPFTFPIHSPSSRPVVSVKPIGSPISNVSRPDMAQQTKRKQVFNDSQDFIRFCDGITADYFHPDCEASCLKKYGMFMIRKSLSAPNTLVLCVRTGEGILKFPIRFLGAFLLELAVDKSREEFATLDELIQNKLTFSIKRDDGTLVTLTFPYRGE